MFILTTTYSNARFVPKDTASLKTRLLSVIRNDAEASRIAAIASSMKDGDVFHNCDIYLKCKEKSDDC